MDTKLILKTNTMNSSAFIKTIRLSSSCYNVMISYCNSDDEETNRLDIKRVSVNANPIDHIYLPKISGTGGDLLLMFEYAIVSDDSIDEFKKCIAIAEDTISQIKEILNEYFS